MQNGLPPLILTDVDMSTLNALIRVINGVHGPSFLNVLDVGFPLTR